MLSPINSFFFFIEKYLFIRKGRINQRVNEIDPRSDFFEIPAITKMNCNLKIFIAERKKGKRRKNKKTKQTDKINKYEKKIIFIILTQITTCDTMMCEANACRHDGYIY